MSPLLGREGSLCSLKGDPKVSAFSPTLKAEQGAEPLWITVLVSGEAQRESLAHPGTGGQSWHWVTAGTAPAMPRPAQNLLCLSGQRGQGCPRDGGQRGSQGLLQTPWIW